MNYLKSYKWPGNIRELRNIIERLTIITADTEITLKDIYHALHPGTNQENDAYINLKMDLKSARENFEKDYIRRVLQDENYNISNSAKVLGIERSNLHRKIKALNIIVKKNN
jgi:two-component system nitrogen regulation response regulator NtrX